MDPLLAGGYLCGAVRYSVTADCYRRMCQRRSGAPAVYRSSPAAERFFRLERGAEPYFSLPDDPPRHAEYAPESEA